MQLEKPAILDVGQLCEYLGVDAQEQAAQVQMLRQSSIEHLCRATGIDWSSRTDLETFNEALRVQVWMSYYAVRDAAKNAEFLQKYLTGLICSLQLCKEEAPDAV